VDSVEADWAAADAKDALEMERAAKQELYEQEGDWDALEALQHEQEQTEEGEEAESGSESENEEEGEGEGEEEAEAESEEETEQSESDGAVAAPAPAADASFSETSAVVTAGLTAEEKEEFEQVLKDIHNDKVSDSVDQQIRDGMHADDAEDAEDEDADADADEEEDAETETDARAATGTALIERAAGGSDDEMDLDEEEVTPEMVSNGERAELLAALGDKFDQEIDLNADEKTELSALLTGKTAADEGWAAPTYNENGLSESDTDADGSAVIEASDVDDEEVLPVEFIQLASRPAAKKRYARMIHRPEAPPAMSADGVPAPVMAEMSGQHHMFMSTGGRAGTDAASRSRRPRGPPPIRGVGVAHSPRRFRLADALASRPNWNRFDPTVQPHPNAQRLAARDMWNRILQMSYDRLEGYCSTRLPEQFTPFCRPLLKRFRIVAEGLRYGDRPNQICMRTRFCPRGSYVRRSPHNVFKHVTR